MSIKIVRTGRELEIREALTYLDRQYGIPAGDITAISVTGEVGLPMAISVTVYVHTDQPAEFHGDRTLRVVHDALRSEIAGLTDESATEIIGAMQNAGILFRQHERVESASE